MIFCDLSTSNPYKTAKNRGGGVLSPPFCFFCENWVDRVKLKSVTINVQAYVRVPTHCAHPLLFSGFVISVCS